MLIARNIYKKYGKTDVLNGIDVEIRPSEIVCILGPSGCGKTTLLKSLSLLELPDHGEIRIDTRNFLFPAKKVNTNDLYPYLTLVFQQFQLWNHLTVRDNILLPVKNKQLNKNFLFEELINYFGLETLLNNYPYQISVGQKQRVAFIRAVLTDPKYLLLDEITSSLDIEYVEKIKSYLIKLAKKGTAILLTTHFIGFAQSISNRIYFINKGKVVEEGDKSILFHPKSERLKQFLTLSEIIIHEE